MISGTTVLRNFVGATTSAELAAAEADLSFARATQLLNDPIPATNDLADLRAIHFRLFQDVYDWAGQLRTVDVKKDVPGAEFFMPFGQIELAATYCFQDLAVEEHLKGLEREEFVERLAFHYEKIDYVHPFREGNGRTQRVFWNRVALEAGWQLDWRPVYGEQNHLAARAGSDDKDLLPFINMFEKIVAPASTKPGELWSAQEIRRLSINTSDTDRASEGYVPAILATIARRRSCRMSHTFRLSTFFCRSEKKVANAVREARGALAAGAYSKAVIDVVHLDIADIEGLGAEAPGCCRARVHGISLHPSLSGRRCARKLRANGRADCVSAGTSRRSGNVTWRLQLRGPHG